MIDHKRRARTAKERHGEDFHARVGAIGGSRKGRGYFGWLKEHDPEKLKEISRRNRGWKKTDKST